MTTISSDFIFNSTNLCVIVTFLTKLWTLGILFSTAVRAVVVVVAKLAILGISPLTSFILALKEALVANFVISGTFSTLFLILALHTSLLTTPFFLLHNLLYLNQQEQVLIYQHVIYLLYFSNCLN